MEGPCFFKGACEEKGLDWRKKDIRKEEVGLETRRREPWCVQTKKKSNKTSKRETPTSPKLKREDGASAVLKVKETPRRPQQKHHMLPCGGGATTGDLTSRISSWPALGTKLLSESPSSRDHPPTSCTRREDAPGACEAQRHRVR
ncbi:hypothetical protein NDU88_005609 [Pleurodeles waltl]|uniref:Uncharacterized protein n=1 Tax=Pleurodeles waltl TaxID=8319 RepID=A0AAV7QJJ3_PLEWA|nr:hypothetical protein NDU88_005609 [Pleurodeles waltl]